MFLRVRNGEMRISIKFFYLLILGLCALILLCLQLPVRYRATTVPICKQDKSPIRRSNIRPRRKEQHKACAKDPVVYNTPESCPQCFRPTVHNISMEFTQVPDELSRLPRGPRGFFKPRTERQQELIQDVLIEPLSVCHDTCPYVVAVLMSLASRVEERNTIRSTWASVTRTKLWPHTNLNADLQIIFVLGRQSKLTMSKSGNRTKPVDRLVTWKEWALIKAEADRFGDLLYLDMVDSYYNLSFKVISALQWARDHCPKTNFFLKVDTDTFVNVPLLVDLLIYNQAMLNISIIGYVYKNGYVFRNGRWAVSKKTYPVNMYPLYTSGCAYILSSQALIKILEVFPYIPIVDLEDVFITGLLVRAARNVVFFTEHLNPIFTAHFVDKWEWCEFLTDHRVAGTGVQHLFKIRLIWSSFVLNDWVCYRYNLIQMYCLCAEEFPRPS